jgi:serine/threonine protein kinase
MLSGRRAFGGGSLLETLGAVVHSEPAPLDSPLAAVVRRCLAKDASQRFQSAAELSASLSELPRQTSAAAAVRDLNALVPGFAANASGILRMWFRPDMADEIIEGLRKAGMQLGGGALQES